MIWVRLLGNEYLVVENRILKDQIKGRLLLSEEEKFTLSIRDFCEQSGLNARLLRLNRRCPAPVCRQAAA
jgi:hypothetical protein